MKWWPELTAAAATLAAFVAGVMLRRKKAAGVPVGADLEFWSIDVDGAKLEVMGPFRNSQGEVEGMKPSDQIAWAESHGARLPTQAEFDQIWEQADVQVAFVPFPVTTAPLTALNDSVNAAIAADVGEGNEQSDRVAAGKTWLSMDDNYGALVNENDTAFNNEGKRVITSGAATGIEVFPTTVPGVFAIQPVSDFHAGTDHEDYSQLGYAVR